LPRSWSVGSPPSACAVTVSGRDYGSRRPPFTSIAPAFGENVCKADAQLSFGSRFLNALSFAFHFDISDYILKGDRAVCCGGGLAPPGALDVRSGVTRMDWLTPV
jgi:hypothetical protein